MSGVNYTYRVTQRTDRLFTWGDGLALIFLAVLIYFGIRLAINAPTEVAGPEISTDPKTLPWYTLLSVSRMAAAYTLSIVFSLTYGWFAAYHKRAEQVLMPLLDVLQSVPILSFLPVVLLSLSAILPEKIAAELASIVLIFTSQAWNITFAWYQSLTTIPKELREASAIFRLNTWMRFKNLELPFGMISLVWNSMMSWAGGWFFLMAAEIFTVGARDYRLPGLGAYLHQAANDGNMVAIGWGLAALVITIVILDQLLWRPLLAWSDRFKVEMVESDEPPTSWFYDLIGDSRLIKWVGDHIVHPITEWIDGWINRQFPVSATFGTPSKDKRWINLLFYFILGAGLLYGLFRVGIMLVSVPLREWGQIGLGILATLSRVLLALIIALAWTVPVGVAVGTNRRLATVIQPIIQIIASVPATAIFPVVVLLILNLPGGLNLAAVILMLMGTQWYLLFNIIAGASAIPQDLKYTTALMQLKGWKRWRILILPAIFPYLVTGAITASGGAWNASIVAEYQIFSGKTLSVTGVGALIAHSTADGNYGLLLASTLSMILIVILINRLIWRRLYVLAESKYRME